MIAISDGRYVAEVYERGAYLSSLKYLDRDLILPGNPDSPTKAGMAFLAPFANRVKGGTYTFGGITYSLPLNSEGNAIHGLLLGVDFDLVDMTGYRVELSTVLEHEGYPSKLKITVSYEMRNGTLTSEARIMNVGQRRAPLVVGWHPYFVVGDSAWSLVSTGSVYRCVSLNKIPTGELREDRFPDHDGSYDDCFYIPSGIIKLMLNGKDYVTLSSSNMRYFQVYTGVRGSVALEPMSGAPDAYHNGIGLSILSPGEEKAYGFSATFTPPAEGG